MQPEPRSPSACTVFRCPIPGYLEWRANAVAGVDMPSWGEIGKHLTPAATTAERISSCGVNRLSHAFVVFTKACASESSRRWKSGVVVEANPVSSAAGCLNKACSDGYWSLEYWSVPFWVGDEMHTRHVYGHEIAKPKRWHGRRHLRNRLGSTRANSESSFTCGELMIYSKRSRIASCRDMA